GSFICNRCAIRSAAFRRAWRGPARRSASRTQRPSCSRHVGVGDLPPTNRASQNLVKFVFGEEDEHEEAFYGRANHRVSEGSRGR
ncbi:hypothetical protein GWC77_28620, partial [Paraburkholderia sp. NMBU_R16]|nr:hypothetical protein [Paraburkholderia sp. NMBU_R16]